MKYDVLGVGSPLIDILIDVDYNFLVSYNLKRGHRFVISEEKMNEILSDINLKKLIISSGDSVANTLSGISNLGGSSIFYGSIGNDKYGDYFKKELLKDNVKFNFIKNKINTGKVLCLITPDKERTFLVNLGASINLKASDINENDVYNSKIIHFTGYQIDDENLREVIKYIIKLAKKFKKLISFDLADPEVIKRNFKFLKTILNDVDIIFANKSEAETFTSKKNPLESLKILSNYAKIVIVKVGVEGSYIYYNNKILKINSIKVNAVDTTGAGDMYAAGILYGISKGFDLETSGKIASKIAAMVVKQKGARFQNRMDVKNLY